MQFGLSDQETGRLTMREFQALQDAYIEDANTRGAGAAHLAALYVNAHLKDGAQRVSPQLFMLQRPKRKRQQKREPIPAEKRDLYQRCRRVVSDLEASYERP